MPLDRPHFLCIGAQKAATTWLAHNLGQHPEIWTPPIKEIHYFDAVQATADDAEAPRRPPAPGESAPPLIADVFRGTHQGRRARKALRMGLGEVDMRWALHYALRRRDDAWYQALFPQQPGLVTGETTPNYAILDERHVASVAERLPGVRVIYLLRDPVERAWSSARMGAGIRVSAPIDEWAEAEQLRFLRRRLPGGLRHSDYDANLGRWERHIPPERLFVGFYEDVVARPAALLTDAYRFLGVDADPEHVPADARQPRNVRGRGRDLPVAAGRWLSEHLADATERVDARFGNDSTKGWLAALARRLEA